MSYGQHLFIVLSILLTGGLLTLIIGVLSYDENPIGLVLAIALGIATVFGTAYADVQTYKSTASTASFTLTKAERVTDSDGKGSRYLIYSPAETFEDTDSFWAFHKTNSSDLYGSLQAGHKYTCTIAGWRVHFLSSYRNLISCQENK